MTWPVYRRIINTTQHNTTQHNTTQHNTTQHNTTQHNTTQHNTTQQSLLPKIKIVFIHDTIHDVNRIVKELNIQDPEFASRLVIDSKNPDYIIATDKSLIQRDLCELLKYYLSYYNDSIFIFHTPECVEANYNIFDYAITWNPDLKFADRIAHYNRYIYDIGNNTLMREEAYKILENTPKFCNFIYSHPQEPRDSFFHMLSRYKRVDSLGQHLNNTDVHSERYTADWYNDSINLKMGYKFSLAIENAAYKGYTTEKIISSLQAHTVPIYWGDPAVTDLINPKAFINCADYDSFDDVIERVKEIDNNNEKWLDMVTQPWQTEEQKANTNKMIDEYNKFLHNIFHQDIKKARRRPAGMWGDWSRKRFTGLLGILPPLHMRIYSKIKYSVGKFIPVKTRQAIKKFFHMY